MASDFGPILQGAWAQVIAYAWKPDKKSFLEAMRKDPKQAIQKVANAGSESEHAEIKDPCEIIIENAEGDDPKGFLGIPDLPSNLEGIDKTQLESLAEETTQMLSATF